MVLEGGNLYESDGKVVRLSDVGELAGALFNEDAMAVVESLQSLEALEIVDQFICDPRTTIIADRKGRPLGIRIRRGRSTRWIVTAETWDIVCESSGLKSLSGLFRYIGVGTCPTPSSMGTKWARKVWWENDLPRHSCPSLGCEQWLHQYSVGGVVYYPGIGEYEKLVYMDMSSAYLSQWGVQPTGTSHWFGSGNGVDEYATYFAECSVTVHQELALGPFPIRKVRDWRQRVSYPTLEGRYDKVYLWKEQVQACRAAGCSVQVNRGWGWDKFTLDCMQWCQQAYSKRKEVAGHPIEAGVKTGIVAAIGHHGMNREHFTLVDGSRTCPDDIQAITNLGEPIDDRFIHAEHDPYSAFMVHWNKYTVMMTNLAVYKFALPYAEQGRLVSMDYDSVMVLEGDETHEYVRKYSVESAACPPGTWLWMLLHNVSVLGARRFKSDELTKLPGTRKAKAVSSSVPVV